MNKKQLIIMIMLTLLLALMDISGLPSVLFLNVCFYDVTPYIISLLVNFILIGILAGLVLKFYGKNWPLALHKHGIISGIKKYATPGLLAGIASGIAFFVGLVPFDYKPTIWKVLIEGIVYYFGVASIEELYVRGLFLNIIDKIAYKRENHIQIAIWISSVIFGLGHIPGMIGMGFAIILFKVISTVGMGLYFGTIYIKTNNLWVPIVLHTFIDICALPYCFTTFSGYKSISIICLVIIYSILGIYSICIMKTEELC